MDSTLKLWETLSQPLLDLFENTIYAGETENAMGINSLALLACLIDGSNY
jgi:hypothetical protein